jgi:hypothetical protein
MITTRSATVCSILILLMAGGDKMFPDLDKLVWKSPVVQKALLIDRDRARWFVEGSRPGWVDYYVGFGMETHYCRSGSLRVWLDGRMAERTYDADGEDLLLWLN